MSLAILVIVPASLAAWAAYWFSGFLGPNSNRASRIASVLCPFLIAGVLALPVGRAFGAEGIDVHELANMSGRVIVGILLLIATVLLIPTMLFAMLAGRLLARRSQTKGYRNS